MGRRQRTTCLTTLILVLIALSFCKEQKPWSSALCFFIHYPFTSSFLIQMGLTVRGSNSGGGEIFRTCPDRPWGPPSLLYNGYRVFPGGKERPGRDADPSYHCIYSIWHYWDRYCYLSWASRSRQVAVTVWIL